MGSTAMRYTFPEWTSTICAESPGDFNVMNNGMRYGLVWAMQPRHYNDSMDEPLTRPLSRYVRELIRIRNKHKDLLFHGRFRDTIGAEVKAGPSVRFSVFEGWSSPGRPASWSISGTRKPVPKSAGRGKREKRRNPQAVRAGRPGQAPGHNPAGAADVCRRRDEVIRPGGSKRS